jgi:hypothetical protein
MNYGNAFNVLTPPVESKSVIEYMEQIQQRIVDVIMPHGTSIINERLKELEEYGQEWKYFVAIHGLANSMAGYLDAIWVLHKKNFDSEGQPLVRLVIELCYYLKACSERKDEILQSLEASLGYSAIRMNGGRFTAVDEESTKDFLKWRNEMISQTKSMNRIPFIDVIKMFPEDKELNDDWINATMFSHPTGALSWKFVNLVDDKFQDLKSKRTTNKFGLINNIHLGMSYALEGYFEYFKLINFPEAEQWVANTHDTLVRLEKTIGLVATS